VITQHKEEHGLRVSDEDTEENGRKRDTVTGVRRKLYNKHLRNM
jgi:hypothetical protein